MGRYNSGDYLGGNGGGAGTGNGAVLNAIFGVGDIYGQGRVLPFFRSGRLIVPPGVESIRSQLWGSGGRGGNGAAGGNVKRSSGAGGGGFSMSIIPVRPGQVIELLVGQGGNQTTPDGGATVLTLDGVVMHQATGGKSGLVGSTTSTVAIQGGEGGTGIGGNVCNFQGGNGGSILITTSSTESFAAGGGAAATRFGKGGNGGNLVAKGGGAYASGGGSVFNNAWTPTGTLTNDVMNVGGGAGCGSPLCQVGGKVFQTTSAGQNMRGYNMGPDVLGVSAVYNSETICPFQLRYLGEHFYGGGGAGVIGFFSFNGIAGSGGVGAGGGGSTAAWGGTGDDASGGSGGAFGDGGGGCIRDGIGGIAGGGGGGIGGGTATQNGGFGGDGYGVIEW